MILMEPISQLQQYLHEMDAVHPLLTRGCVFWLALLICVVLHLVLRFAALKGLHAVIAQMRITEKKGIRKLSSITNRILNILFLVVFYAILAFCDIHPVLLTILQKVFMLGIVLCAAQASIHGCILFEIWYNKRQNAAAKPIHGGIQLAKIFLFICTLILCVSILLNRSPIFLLSSLGAAAAVLMLIFQDTLLSIVSGLQLGANKQVSIGDWIYIPSEDVDGIVTEVALHTITVKSWDNTVVAVPVRKLTGTCFTNYRAMFQSGGRRIKRSLFLDIHSIRFLTDSEIQRLRDFALLDGYIDSKQAEIDEWNQNLIRTGKKPVNCRRITNIGIFRIYVNNYLRSLPTINQEMILLVRQLQSQSTGLPLEIYCFSSKTSWVDYETIQADIFDHLFAILPLFGLKVFQRSSDSRSCGDSPEEGDLP